jgi:hypothetical protein
MVNMRRQSLNEEGALKQDIHHIHEAEKIYAYSKALWRFTFDSS